MSGFSRVRTQRRELLASGRLFGLRRSGGALVPAFSRVTVQTAGVPAEAKRMVVSASGDLYLSSGSMIYRSTASVNTMFMFSSGFAVPPYFVKLYDDGNYMLAVDGVKALEIRTNSAQLAELPALVAPALHYSRMFAVDNDDRYTVRWSQPGDALGWEYGLNGAGYVKVDASRGEIKRLISCDNRLYIVCGKGLFVMRAYGDAEDFRLENTDTDTDEIIEDTAAACAGKLFFFTQSGLWTYDGTLRRFEADGLEGFSAPVCAAAVGSDYFVCGQLDGSGAIACIDGRDGSVSYIDEPADCCCLSEELLFHKSGEIFRLAAGGTGRWESGATDFGCSGVKYLDGIEVDGAAEKLTVTSGGRTRVFTDVRGRVKVGLEGGFFEIAAETSSALRGITACFAARG